MGCEHAQHARCMVVSNMDLCFWIQMSKSTTTPSLCQYYLTEIVSRRKVLLQLLNEILKDGKI